VVPAEAETQDIGGVSTMVIRSEKPTPQAGKARLRLDVIRTWRGDLHAHAVSQACAALFVRA